ncbi:helix-turn-helix domain-containing protein [Spirosoma aerophilum]
MDNNTQDKLYKLLGQKIRESRTLLKVTQEHLASQIGLTRTSIVNIEQGRQNPPLHLIIQIARALNVPLETLIPKEQDYMPAAQLDEETLKDVSDVDKSKVEQFYETFLKTHSHDPKETKTDRRSS